MNGPICDVPTTAAQCSQLATGLGLGLGLGDQPFEGNYGGGCFAYATPPSCAWNSWEADLQNLTLAESSSARASISTFSAQLKIYETDVPGELPGPTSSVHAIARKPIPAERKNAASKMETPA